MRYQKGFISSGDIMMMCVVLVIIGVIIGCVLTIGVPWLWGVLKPFIHTITA